MKELRQYNPTEQSYAQISGRRSNFGYLAERTEVKILIAVFAGITLKPADSRRIPLR